MAGFQSYPTPHPTPLVDDDPLDALCLIRSRRVGPATFHRLIADHGSARAALVALPGIAAAAGVDRYEICPRGVVLAEMKAGHALGARLLVHGQAGYPAALMDIADAPPVLWVRGDAFRAPTMATIGRCNRPA